LTLSPFNLVFFFPTPLPTLYNFISVFPNICYGRTAGEVCKVLEEYAEYLKNNGKPIIDAPLTPEEILSEALRIRAKSKVKAEHGWIYVDLNDGIAEHWAHIEGEVIIKLDKLYRQLKMEIKDAMDSEKVLKDADLFHIY
jgi:hypothetical protein